MTATQPRNALVLARISDARDGDTRGVRAQVDDAQALADRLGWKVGPAGTHVVVENDTSAFKRKKIIIPDGVGGTRTELRTVRPGFRRALAYLSTGHADGLIALDLDRACRDPRDLEDLIDVVEARRVPVESVTGSLRLATDADVTMARIMVSVANKSSRDTGRRVARARLRQAAEGRYGGGRRAYGYDRQGMALVESEAAEVCRAADAILAGASLRSCVRDLTARAVPTVTGAPWVTRTLRDILVRPRTAGLAVYKGQIAGRGAWPPILPEDQWRALTARLTDPARRSSPGNAPRWLGSLIYQCGICANGTTMVVGGGRVQSPSYICRAAQHLRRQADPLDAMVEAHVVAYLSRPDSANVVSPRTEVDTAGLSREANTLRGRLEELARMFADGAISAGQLRAATVKLNSRLADIEADMSAASADEPLAGVAGRADAADIWQGLALDRRRAIVRQLVKVVVMPQAKGRKPGGGYFDPQAVTITFNGR